MAKKKQTEREEAAREILANLTQPLVVTPDDKHTGTIASRKKAETARQKAARAERDALAKEARA